MPTSSELVRRLLEDDGPVYGFYPHMNPRVPGKPDTLGTPQARSALAEALLGVLPGSGEALSARDAWNASGRAGDALMEGRFGDAATGYGDMLTGVLGALPGAGIVARGTKRGAAWMDRNAPAWVNRLLDAAMPVDPKNTTFIFAGPTAKTADHAALAKAQEMAGQGASRDDIWRDTGWFQGADGKWRFEISDKDTMLSGKLPHNDLFGTLTGASRDPMTKFSGIVHPLLGRAYPDYKPQIKGAYQRGMAPIGRYDPASERVLVQGPREGDALSTTLHELQHGVQKREGFSPGGNPWAVTPEEIAAERARLGKAQDVAPGWTMVDVTPETDEGLIRDMLYRRMAGEVEARNVQSRMNMTPAERRATPPWATQDTPDERQIMRFR